MGSSIILGLPPVFAFETAEGMWYNVPGSGVSRSKGEILMKKRIISLILASIMILAVVPLSGCAKKAPDGSNTNEPTAEPTAEPAITTPDCAEPTLEPTPEPTPAVTEEPEPAYEYDPHLFVPMIIEDVPQDYWDSFHNLCDALLAGETTFECSSEAAYKWATDVTVLAQLFPAACLKIKAQSDDGSAAFENGVGKISYQIPVDEFLERQARFEELVTGVLNEYLDADDDDFEKSLKLYNYMESNYTYNYDFIESKSDGYVYYTIMNHSGQCVDLGSVYAFFLLQAGVEAVLCGGQSPDMDHDWTYLVIDGQGYFSDPTWSLKVLKDDPLELYYFLMDAERRAETGFDIENLQVSLLPRYWVSFSSFKPAADSDEYCFPYGSYLISLDEENKTVHYTDYDGEHNLSYAHEPAAD
jgi:hypothetical protein